LQTLAGGNNGGSNFLRLAIGVRGDLLHRLGRYEEARAAFEAAAELAGNRRDRNLMQRRAAEAADAIIQDRPQAP